MRTLVAACGLALAACASPAEPPGGPDDFDPPIVVAVVPDSGRTSVRPEWVEFRFDEVVREPASLNAAAPTIRISPTDGPPVVRWRRDRIQVRPRSGWRENTTYVITLEPGVGDLAGNTRDTALVVVFATGDVIPNTRVDGVVFDWTTAQVASRTLVEARPADDSTLIFATQTDSLGRFLLPFLAPGSYRVRTVLDGNGNGVLDPREKWDSTTLALTDSARLEFYAFDQDTFPPRLTTVTAPDSVTLRLSFDHPLDPQFVPLGAIVLVGPDSAPIPLARVGRWKAMMDERTAREAQLADSLLRVTAATDTTEVGLAARARIAATDSLRAAQATDSVAKVGERPQASRPALETDVLVELAAPLTAQERYLLRAEVRGVNGKVGASERPYTPPRPPPTTARDTTGMRAPRP
jgi:hypothetical protein